MNEKERFLMKKMEFTMKNEMKRCGVENQRSGFTLIELLVVISIIALLLSISMPALRAARMQARQLLCATNMRALGLGIVIYGDQNDGHLPMNVYQEKETRRDRSSPWASYFIGMYAASVADGTPQERWDNMVNGTGGTGGWVGNLGYLFKEGLLDGGIEELAYCPSNKSVSFSFQTYGGATNFPSSEDGTIRCSYSYLPQHKSRKHPAPIMADFPDAAYKISNLDSRRSMVLDVLHEPDNMYHSRGSIFGVNMLMGDTSVSFKIDSDDIIGDYYEQLGEGLLTSSNPVPWRDVIRQFERK